MLRIAILVLVMLVTSAASAQSKEPSPGLVGHAWITVTTVASPSVSTSIVRAGQLALEALIRLRPGATLGARPPGAAGRAYAIEVRVLRLEATGDRIRAAVELRLLDPTSHAMLATTSGAVTATPMDAATEERAIEEAARAAYRGLAGRLVP